MNLTYEILWFEDEEEVVKEDIGQGIVNYLKKLGYKPIITHEKDGSNLDALLSNRNYDLIISDLNLGQNETGDTLVESIRTQSIFTEVLLYSAVSSDIRKIIERNGTGGGMIERISFSVGIRNLTKKIKGIIDLTLKKVQDVSNMRGLVIAETIDLEIIIEECVQNYFELSSEVNLIDKKDKLLDEIFENKKRSCQKTLQNIDNSHDSTIEKLIDDDIITVYDLYMALQSILKDNIKEINVKLSSGISQDAKNELLNKKEKINLLKTQLNSFNEDIIKLRNTLAHVKEKKNNEGISYLESINKNGLKILFNNERYSEIRINLNKHHDNLIEISEIIKLIIESKKQVAASTQAI